jgi:hypothetical protein
MQRFEAAVILMKTNSKEYNVLFPDRFIEDDFTSQKLCLPFDDLLINFLNSLSKALFNDISVKNYPDVATFAFFCRKSNITSLKDKYLNNDEFKIGRGIVFHITPSNVPVNFAYSLVSGLLAGNANIIRIPSKQFEQINIIINALNSLKKILLFKEILNKIVLVGYDKKSIATDYFSSLCDVRVIWGGDETINTIRKSSIKPKSFDITFSNRYSFTVINADEYVKEKNTKKIAIDFFNDTYLFDQNACSSPHLIIWLGVESNVIKSKNIFWSELNLILNNNYELSDIIAIDKLTNFYMQSIDQNFLKRNNPLNNKLWRIELKELTSKIELYKCAGGYFSEYHAENLKAIDYIINTKYQTMSYYGLTNDQINNFLFDIKPKGIDRIVPIGKTTDFSIIWDGFNLINSLSRIITVS